MSNSRINRLVFDLEEGG